MKWKLDVDINKYSIPRILTSKSSEIFLSQHYYLNHISSRLLENNYEYYTFVIANLNVINVVVVKILIQLFETSRKLFSHLSFPLYNIPR